MYLSRVIRVGVFVALVIGCLPSNCQDVHFSQLAQEPLFINPALTGVFNGKMRALVNFKDQWRPLGKTYQSSAFSFDTEVMRKPQKSNYFGVGLSAFSDKAGTASVKTNSISLSLAGIIEVAERQLLSAGIQTGLGQQSISIGDAKTSAQYINGYNPSLPSGESRNSEPLFYGDFSLGIVWSKWSKELNMTSNDESRSTFGIAFHHINRPQIGFNDQADQLYSKLVFHGGMYIGIKNTPLALLPGGAVSVQGPAMEINLGSYLRYRIKEDSRYTGLVKETSMLVGLHTRIGDAFIPSLMVVIADYAISVSYDINTSSLSEGSSGRGGIEFALRFLSSHALVRGKGRGSMNDGM